MKYKEVQKLIREHPWLKTEIWKCLMSRLSYWGEPTQSELATFVNEQVKGICFQDWNNIKGLHYKAEHQVASLVAPNDFVLQTYVSLELAIYYHLAQEKPHARVWRSNPHSGGRKKNIGQAIVSLIKQDTMDAGLVFDSLVVHTFSYADGHRHTYTTIYPFPEQKPQEGMTCGEFELIRKQEGKPLFSEPEVQAFARHACDTVSQRFCVVCAPFQLSGDNVFGKWFAKRPREEWERIYLEALQNVIQEKKDWDEREKKMDELLKQLKHPQQTLTE